MATAIQLKGKEFLTRSKIIKKDANKQTVETLKQLLMRPNITIKKTVLLENYKAQISPQNELSEPVQINSATANNLATQKSPKKKVQNSKSLLIQENKEYYPNKLKRNVCTKKILLHPKHDYKVVATTNKRKRTVPQKEPVSLETRLFQLTKSDHNPGLSIEDLVITADDEGMNDEDFMEILTCPSPVWWEGAEEDEIGIFQDKSDENLNWNDCENKSQNRPITCNNINGNSLKNDINFFKKFVRKRTKLENVLGNIKCKKNKQDKPNFNSNIDDKIEKVRKNSVGGLSDVSLNEEELLHSLEIIQIPVQELKSDCEEEIIQNETSQITDTIKIKNSNIYLENDKPNQKTKNRKVVSRKVRKCNDLTNAIRNGKQNYGSESNGVAIRKIKKCNEPAKTTRNPKHNYIVGASGKKLKRLKNCDNLNNTDEISEVNYEIDVTESNSTNNESRILTKCDQLNNTIGIVTNGIAELNEKKNDICIPDELPPLTKNPFQFINNTESPESIVSTLSRTTNSSNSEIDSISDTNVKFLDECNEPEMEKSNVKIKINNGNIMKAYKKLVAAKIESFDAEVGIKINLVNKLPVGEIPIKMNSVVKQPNNKIKCKDGTKLNENQKIKAFYKPKKTNYRKKVICKRDI